MLSFSFRLFFVVCLAFPAVSFGAETTPPEETPAATPSPQCGPAMASGGRRLSRRAFALQVVGGVGAVGAAWWFFWRPPQASTRYTDAVPVISPQQPRLGPPVFAGLKRDAWTLAWPTMWPELPTDPASPELLAAEAFLTKHGGDWDRVARDFPDKSVRFVRVQDLAAQGLPPEIAEGLRAPLAMAYIAPRSQGRWINEAWHQTGLVVVDFPSASSLLVGYAQAVYDREIFPQRYELPSFTGAPFSGAIHPQLWSAMVLQNVGAEVILLQRGLEEHRKAIGRTLGSENAFRRSLRDAMLTEIQLKMWAKREAAAAKALAHYFVLQRALSGKIALSEHDFSSLAVAELLSALSYLAEISPLRAELAKATRSIPEGLSPRSQIRFTTLTELLGRDAAMGELLFLVGKKVLEQLNVPVPQGDPL